jgi:hypothetical protein
LVEFVDFFGSLWVATGEGAFFAGGLVVSLSASGVTESFFTVVIACLDCG